MCEVDGRAVVAGVTSWGIGCGVKGFPGLYADVHQYSDWIKAIVENDVSNEEVPEVNEVTYVDVDFFMSIIDSITGPVYCIGRNGDLNQDRTSRVRSRMEFVNLRMKQRIQMKVLVSKHCAVHHAGQVTTDRFFQWADRQKTFPLLRDEATTIASFMLQGCKQKLIENHTSQVHQVFTRYQNLVNRVAEKGCFGGQEKVIRNIFKF